MRLLYEVWLTFSSVLVLWNCIHEESCFCEWETLLKCNNYLLWPYCIVGNFAGTDFSENASRRSRRNFGAFYFNGYVVAKHKLHTSSPLIGSFYFAAYKPSTRTTKICTMLRFPTTCYPFVCFIPSLSSFMSKWASSNICICYCQICKPVCFKAGQLTSEPAVPIHGE